MDDEGSGHFYNTRYRSNDGPYHALNIAESTANGATIADAWYSIVAEVTY